MENNTRLEFLRTYTTSRTTIRVYLVHCSDKLKRRMMKDNPYYREDNKTGKPLYFNVRDLPTNAKCQIHHTGRVIFVNPDSLEGF